MTDIDARNARLLADLLAQYPSASHRRLLEVAAEVAIKRIEEALASEAPDRGIIESVAWLLAEILRMVRAQRSR